MDENIKTINATQLTIETPYGDKFVTTDRYINIHGDVVEMWTTSNGNALPSTPDELSAKGYKIIARGMTTKSYKRGEDGIWERAQ